MRPVIHSVKHYQQVTLSTVTTVSRNTEELVKSVVVTDANLAREVQEGAIVKAIYVELWIIGATLDQFFTITLSKDVSGITALTFAQMTDLNAWSNKKNILYTTQGLASNDGVGNPIAIIRQWFKIPKSKQRFGLGDAVRLSIASRGSDDIKYCGFATFKSYT